MPVTTNQEKEDRLRNLLFLSKPALWPVWPFLPLVRRKPGQKDECGILYDQLTVAGRTGHSSTVYFANLLLLPTTEAEFLALPREVYDSPEEVYAAGWRVD
jgi:hypothetical protein